MGFWVAFAVSLVINVVAYALMPKPDKPGSGGMKPQDLDEPIAEAGKPVPVVFGEITVKSPNVLFYGDVDKETHKVKA